MKMLLLLLSLVLLIKCMSLHPEVQDTTDEVLDNTYEYVSEARERMYEGEGE